MTILPRINGKYHSPVQAPRERELTGPYLDPLSRRLYSESLGRHGTSRGPDIGHRKRGTGEYSRWRMI